MFSERIVQTEFTSGGVDSMFPIQGDEIYDSVFMTTLRAVLPPRMGDDSLNVTYRESNVDLDDCKNHNYTDGEIARAVFSDAPHNPNRLIVVNMKYMSVIDDRILSAFLSEFDGYEQRKIVSTFFEQFHVLCFKNVEIKSVVIVVSRLDVQRIHYITASLPAWFPWYFSKDKHLTDEERALFESLRKTSKEPWLEAIKPFESRYDFYSLRLQALGDFETRWMQGAITELANNINAADNSICSLRDEIAGYLRNIEDYSIRIAGIQAKMEEENSGEIRDYLIENKGRVFMSERKGDSLTFETVTPLAYWDPDTAETLYENKRSLVYTQRGGKPRMSSNDMGLLFKAIFIDMEVVLQLCAAYKMDVRERRVRGESNYHFGSECIGALPNTHINWYSCLGAYEDVLNSMMRQHDYVGIMEQCVVSCGSLNLNDTPVLKKFMESLYSCNSKVIKLPNGNFVTPFDAVVWLKAKEEKNDGENVEV